MALRGPAIEGSTVLKTRKNVHYLGPRGGRSMGKPISARETLGLTGEERWKGQSERGTNPRSRRERKRMLQEKRGTN